LDDGCFEKTARGVTLATHSFSELEVNLLAKTLTNKFGLNCAIYKNKGGFIIRISTKSLKDLQTLLEPLMPPMMLCVGHKVMAPYGGHDWRPTPPAAAGPRNYDRAKARSCVARGL